MPPPPLAAPSPVHDEASRDQHVLQVAHVVFGDAEVVQVVAPVPVRDLEGGERLLQCQRTREWDNLSALQCTGY